MAIRLRCRPVGLYDGHGPVPHTGRWIMRTDVEMVLVSERRGGRCRHELSGLPCVNARPHAGDGRGCVHLSTSGVPDRHDYGDDE